MDVGVVAIRSLSSNFYLAISWKGEVYGSVSVHRAHSLEKNPTSPEKLVVVESIALLADVMGVVAATECESV